MDLVSKCQSYCFKAHGKDFILHVGLQQISLHLTLFLHLDQGSATFGPRLHLPFVNINPARQPHHPARLPLYPARDPSAKKIIISNQCNHFRTNITSRCTELFSHIRIAVLFLLVNARACTTSSGWPTYVLYCIC